MVTKNEHNLIFLWNISEMKNKGMLFEKIINKTINIYRRDKIALFHKKELDIKFKTVKSFQNKKTLDNAWIAKRSTVDYYGVFKGRFIAFEAKSTLTDLLPLKNIKDHQINYLKLIKEQGGIAFLFIYYDRYNEAFLLFTESLSMVNKKSISYEFVNRYGYKVTMEYPGIFDFISVLKKCHKTFD